MYDLFGLPLKLARQLLSSLRLIPLRDILVQRSSPTGYTKGDRAEMTHVFTHLDVFGFYATTGDSNPVHTNGVFANATPFKGPIAHGMDVGSMFSTIFANGFPGVGTIYLEQSLRFLAPVHLGDRVVASVVLIDLLEKNGARFSCIAKVGDVIVIEGEAKVKLPKISRAD